MTNMQVKQFNEVFPDFATIQGSCLFIKKLIAISLSAVTYIRGVFPDKAYGDKDLHGIKLKILKEDSGLKSVEKFIDLVRNCYEAVEKKYLQQMSLGIVVDPQKRDEVVELYNLKFNYRDDECSLSCNKEKTKFSTKTEEVRQATVLMLKNICTISDMLETLPKNTYITMKLCYYDDVTPPDYEPKGFSSCDNEKFEFTGEVMHLKLGQVNTNNHGYKFYLKSTLGKIEMPHPSENSLLNSSQTSTRENGIIEDNHQEVLSSPTSEILKSNPDALFPVQCPCDCAKGNVNNTIKCISCGKRHHKVCYGILKPEDIPLVFYCVDCILANTDCTSNQDLIYSCYGEERKKFCEMRRALVLCSFHDTVSSSILEKNLTCTKTAASSLIQRLESEGFITKTSKYKYRVILEDIKDRGFESYFSCGEKENIHNESFYNEDSQDMGSYHSNGFEKNYSSPNVSDKERDIIEESICQVESLILTSRDKEMKLSQENKQLIKTRDSQQSKKRKLSKALLSPDNSEELFPSTSLKQKKPKTRGRSQRY